jgi:protein dithiol:quinone oxidoreductase
MSAAQTVAGRAGRSFTLVFVACVGIIGWALYLQHAEGLDPCPWCILQRLIYIAIGLVALVAALWRPDGILLGVFSGLIGLLSLSGVAAAGYHLLLQQDPERARACNGSVLEKLLDQSHLGQMIPPLLQYDGPCTLKPWFLLDLSIPAWSLIGFVLMLLAAVLLPFIARR